MTVESNIGTRAEEPRRTDIVLSRRELKLQVSADQEGKGVGGLGTTAEEPRRTYHDGNSNCK